MGDLDNSKRSLLRATYTPIQTPERPQQPPPRKGRAIDKWNALTSIQLQGAEVKALRKAFRNDEAMTRVLDLAERAAPKQMPSGANELEAIPLAGAIAVEDIQRLGDATVELRKQQLQDAETYTKRIDEGLNSKLASASSPQTRQRLPSNLAAVPGFVSARFPGATLFSTEKITETPHQATASTKARRTSKTSKGRTRAGTGRKNSAFGQRTSRTFLLRRNDEDVPPPSVSVQALPLALGSIAAALDEDGSLRPEVAHMLELASTFSTAIDPQQMSLKHVAPALLARLQATKDAMYGLSRRVEIDPLGYLHLERVSFIPSGIERGELVYSVPLSPGEEVNITHREWSNTSEEFERIVTDYFESFSEEGVTEKSELSQATNSQDQHTSGFNMSVTASGGYGPVSISATAGFNIADSSTRSQQFSRNQSSELTRKASSRTKKEHKVSFRVASASGTEEEAVRKIKNPFDDRATRIDYYQLLRRWRVDLHRYGVRLTYDLTIPEPGSDILSKIIEVRRIQSALGQGFGAPDADLEWARFDLSPSSISRGNFATLAALYGAAIEPPPAAEVRAVRAFTRQWSTFDESKRAENTAFEVEVPTDYYLQSVNYTFDVFWWEGAEYQADVLTDFSHWVGATGRLTASVFSWQLSAFTLELTLVSALSDEAFEGWQMRAWGALRDAALARYEMNRANLKARLQQLQEELGGQDALSLRKIEREEVAKGVLRWMFGPSFEFVPAGLPSDLYGVSQSVVSPSVWARVTAHGEMIQFIHHAIEWENMLYFLYPYYWSHTERWDLKKDISHPDFMHRTFLRAGSARVVLTIRPGFERDFVSFVESGSVDGLTDHPYLTIAEEMQAFASTNYPGIRPANPTENARPLLSPIQRRAWQEMQSIIDKLEQHKADHGAYPTTEAGLAALTSYGDVPDRDPWGRPYVYRSPGQLSDFELFTLGADGVEGGEGDDGDITSWAEASLIGRWYEYTPTGALDIAFGETLPTS